MDLPMPDYLPAIERKVMKKKDLLRQVGLISVIIIFSCISIYFVVPQEIRWALTAFIDVPSCAKPIAAKLGIRPDFLLVKDKIIELLKPGMTPDEVRATLTQYGNVSYQNTSTDELDNKMDTELHINLCDNPFGNIVLLIYYKDNRLVNIVDPYDN
jgi:hypothetical protein